MYTTVLSYFINSVIVNDDVLQLKKNLCNFNDTGNEHNSQTLG